MPVKKDKMSAPQLRNTKLRDGKGDRQVHLTELSLLLKCLMFNLSLNIDVFDQAHQTQANAAMSRKLLEDEVTFRGKGFLLDGEKCRRLLVVLNSYLGRTKDLKWFYLTVLVF